MVANHLEENKRHKKCFLISCKNGANCGVEQSGIRPHSILTERGQIFLGKDIIFIGSIKGKVLPEGGSNVECFNFHLK